MEDAAATAPGPSECALRDGGQQSSVCLELTGAGPYRGAAKVLSRTQRLEERVLLEAAVAAAIVGRQRIHAAAVHEEPHRWCDIAHIRRGR